MDERVNFSGRKDNVFKEKLPEGFAQADQNSRRRTRGIWRPRQGLSRPAGIGKSAERIDSIGYGEVGIKTGLLIEHGGSIDGYAIGVNDVSPVWTPPPPRDWFYEAPTLTVLQTGSGEVTLTPASTNSYVITFNFYRDGVFIGTGDTLVDTEAVDGADYTTEAVTDAGVTSIPSAPVTALVFGTYISDNFNRADGALGASWTPFLGLDHVIASQRVRPVGASTGDEYHSTGVKVPMTFSMQFIRTSNLTVQGGWIIRLHPTAATLTGPYGALWYDPTYAGGTGRWWLQAVNSGGTSSISALQLGAPSTTGALTVAYSADGKVTVTVGSVSVTSGANTTNIGITRYPAIQINTAADGAIMFADTFAGGGATP